MGLIIVGCTLGLNSSWPPASEGVRDVCVWRSLFCDVHRNFGRHKSGIWVEGMGNHVQVKLGV